MENNELSDKILRIIISEYVSNLGDVNKKTLDVFELISKKIALQINEED
jgi:hypothetical protein